MRLMNIGKENNMDISRAKELIEKGDTITLYIPNIVDEYPDMVSEGWTLSDTIAFAKEYKINLTVYDENKTLIPESEYNNLSDIKVIYQQRAVGDTIIEGIGFYIQINTTYTNTEIDTNQDVSE